MEETPLTVAPVPTAAITDLSRSGTAAVAIAPDTNDDGGVTVAFALAADADADDDGGPVVAAA
jgi:hypothetical protein